ncbi:prepilin-type N-terminal cleavage/methylation domain-containing protein [Parelusimicrobium proximum]|uniref:prepilin-type N-terminal cleavage/methylation domain-containing protein n=1 Tax=Parelusimicrobium proximum TaxID=3228953 RepID=UPI003D171F96
MLFKKTPLTPPRFSHLKNKGFTLIEIAVVVVIIAVLAALSVPMYQKSVERSKATEAASILSKIISEQEKTASFNNGKYAEDFEHLGHIIQGKKTTGKTLESQNFTYTLEKVGAASYTKAEPKSKYNYTIRTSGYSSANLCAEGADASIVSSLFKGCNTACDDVQKNQCTSTGGAWDAASCTCSCGSGQTLVSGLCKTACAATCPSGHYRNTAVDYAEDGSCCKSSTCPNVCNEKQNQDPVTCSCSCKDDGKIAKCTSTGGKWSSSACGCNCLNDTVLKNDECINPQTACDPLTVSRCNTLGGKLNGDCSCCPPNSAHAGGACVCNSGYEMKNGLCAKICNAADREACNGQWNSNTCNCVCTASKEQNCKSSYGSWDSKTCSCSCPQFYAPTSEGKCEANLSSCTKDTTCGPSGGTWDDESCTCTCPRFMTLKKGKCVARLFCISPKVPNADETACVCPEGTVSTDGTCKTPCPSYCEAGDSRVTDIQYYEDGPCCARVAAGGGCKGGNFISSEDLLSPGCCKDINPAFGYTCGTVNNPKTAGNGGVL